MDKQEMLFEILEEATIFERFKFCYLYLKNPKHLRERVEYARKLGL